MYGLPARRLQALIKTANPEFDETWTVGLTSLQASCLLWVITNIHPCSKSTAIGAQTYRQGKERCRTATQRFKKLIGKQKYDLMLTEVLRAGPSSFVSDVMHRYGFDTKWVAQAEEEASEKKRRKGALLGLVPGPLAPAQGDAQTPPDLAPLALFNAEAPPDLAPSASSQSNAQAPPGLAPLAPAQGIGQTPPDSAPLALFNAEAPPDLAPFAPSQGHAWTPPDLAPLAPSHSNAEAPPDLAPRTTSQSDAEAPPDLAPLAPAQGNADAPPDLAPLAPAQGLTSEQQARIEENRALAFAKRRAKSKAQPRRPASPSNETDDEDITDEGAPQSRGPISDREMAARDSVARPTCVICQDVLATDEQATALECGHVFHSACIETYAQSKAVTLARACPFKCRAPEEFNVDDDDEAEQQRASLPAGLLRQAQQAEHTADAAFT